VIVCFSHLYENRFVSDLGPILFNTLLSHHFCFIGGDDDGSVGGGDYGHHDGSIGCGDYAGGKP
jgi:hypothetical protein